MAVNIKTAKLSKYTKFGIYFVIVALLNIAINLTPPGKIDITANKLFSISRASKEVVKTLEEPLTIKVFFTDNLPAYNNYNSIKPYLRDLLKEYADNSRGNYFNYEFIDVGGGDDSNSEKIQENKTMASDYNINPVNVEAIEKDEASFKLAYMGMAFIHGDVIETISPIKSTNGLEFQITSTIQKMNNKISSLLALDKNIQVRLYLTSAMYDLFSDARKVPDMVKKVVDEVNKQNYDKIDYVLVDTTKDPDKVAEAEKLNAYGFTKGPDKYFGDIFVAYGNRTEQIRVLELARSLFGGYAISMASEDDLKSKINDAITSLINTNEKIGYLVSNDTMPLNEKEQNPYAYPPQQQQDGITNFKELISDEYSLVEVNLEDGEIPEGINCLIIGGPKGQFTDYELYQIDQFLMKGKSLAVFLDGMKIEMPQQNPQLYGYQQPQYKVNQTGLESLLEYYGVVVEPSYVMDEDGYKQTDPNRGRYTAYQIPVVQNDKLNTKIDFVKDIRGVILYGISPLSVDEAKLKENNIKAIKLFSSSDKSWTAKELPNQQTEAYMTPPFDDKDKKSYPLAYVLEGRFKSYFADKAIPEKPEKKNDTEESGDKAKPEVQIDAKDVTIANTAITKGESGKVFVIGSSFVLDNQLFNTQIGPNVLMYLNIIDYLNGRGDYAVMRTKLQQYNPLNPTSEGFKNFVKVFNIGVIPALVVAFGVLVFLRRKARKLTIQQQFSRNTNTNKEVKA